MEYILLATVLFLLVLLLSWKRKHKTLDLPGPKGWPFFGSYFEMRGKHTHKILTDWAGRYGPAFKFSLFGKEYLVVNSPETLREVFVNRERSFDSRHETYQIRETSEGFKTLVDTNNLALNGAMRKALNACLQPSGTGREELAKALNSSVDVLLDSFQKANGEASDPMDSVFEALTQNICIQLCGEELGDLASLSHLIRPVIEAVTESATESAENLLLDWAPWLQHVPGFHQHEPVLRFKEQIDDVKALVVLPAFEDGRDAEKNTLRNILLKVVGKKYTKGNDSVEITMQHVILTALDVVIAGTDTTAVTFTTLINILQHHPEMQEKAYREIASEIGLEKMIELDDKEKLPYCQALLHEVLRYSAVGGLGLGRSAREDTMVGGVAVPRGTDVITNIWACHHNPEYWPDPWTFIPERFLDDEGSLIPPDHATRKHWFPFGGGGRGCIGKTFALNRLFVYVTNSLQRYKFLPTKGADPESCDPRNALFSLVMRPVPFLTRAIPRI